MRAVRTERAPAAVGPYSQAVVAGNFVFVSGQIPLDARTGKVVEGGVEAQAEQAFRNLAAVLEAAGSSLNRVVKVTLYIKNMSDFSAVNEVYARFFGGEVLPARACVEVSALPKGVLIEVEAIGIVGEA